MVNFKKHSQRGEGRPNDLINAEITQCHQPPFPGNLTLKMGVGLNISVYGVISAWNLWYNFSLNDLESASL